MSSWIYSWFKVDTEVKSGISANAEVSYHSREGWDASADVLLAGAEVSVSTFEASKEHAHGELTLSGPCAGVDVGLKANGVSAMAEASVVKAENTLGPLYVSMGLNANTGITLQNGVQVCFLGFGINFGVNGRWGVDTPVGGVGASTVKVKNENRQYASQKVYARAD